MVLINVDLQHTNDKTMISFHMFSNIVFFTPSRVSGSWSLRPYTRDQGEPIAKVIAKLFTTEPSLPQ